VDSNIIASFVLEWQDKMYEAVTSLVTRFPLHSASGRLFFIVKEFHYFKFMQTTSDLMCGLGFRNMPLRIFKIKVSLCAIN
jgi:hypothetical protein